MSIDLFGVNVKTETRIYHLKNFVRKNVTGNVDPETAAALADEYIKLACLYPGHNILIDLRKATVSMNLVNQMQLTQMIGRRKPSFGSRIAQLVPDDPQRLQMARQFESCMVLKGYAYKIFTDFESAIEWLAEPAETYYANY